MNNTASDSTQETNTLPPGDQQAVFNFGFGYGIAIFISVFIVFVIINYAVNKCKKMQNRPSTTTTSDLDHHSSSAAATNNIGASTGVDEATLSSYPIYTYSQLKLHNPASACSICLADYDRDDSLRLLPECGHVFHLSCIDPWLLKHPTCPNCRNSPLTTRAQTTLLQPAPFLTQ